MKAGGFARWATVRLGFGEHLPPASIFQVSLHAFIRAKIHELNPLLFGQQYN